MPTVSIIIPIYNVETYLRECLDSVLTQTFTDWECIMVDDCSTDGSAAIARSFLKDPRFVMLSHDRNRGQSAARNTALDVAKGRFISFADADDSLTPDNLEILLRHDDCDISVGQETDMNVDRDCELSGKEACLRSLYQNPGFPRVTCSPWGKLFRKELFERVSFAEGIIYEDLDLITRLLLKAGRVGVSGRKIYRYNLRSGSTITTFGRKRLDVLAVTERLENDFADDRELLAAARDRRLSANFNMFLLLTRHGLGHTAEADACWSQICRLRRDSLGNRHVRLKNKLGIIASYAGRPTLSLLSKIGNGV